MSVILATAGSNSSTSINFNLVKYTVSLIKDRGVQCIELAGYAFPMYSEDLEKSDGIPEIVTGFRKQIEEAEALILSVNEHNGNPSAFFKNILDWLSRDERKFLVNTPVFLMSASGGKRGAASSRDVVAQMLKRFGAEVVSTFSLHNYYDCFDPQTGITDPGQASLHEQALNDFLAYIDAR